jgi:hypothetical protein
LGIGVEIRSGGGTIRHKAILEGILKSPEKSIEYFVEQYRVSRLTLEKIIEEYEAEVSLDMIKADGYSGVSRVRFSIT